MTTSDRLIETLLKRVLDGTLTAKQFITIMDAGFEAVKSFRLPTETKH